MRITRNVVLITGGASGIGFALAQAFMKAGNTVIICGRRKGKLQKAKATLPGLHVRQCDVTDSQDGRALLEWTISNFPDLNVLVNNAGIQREIDLRSGASDIMKGESEIAVNLEAPIHLSARFIPHLLRKKEAAIVNITSGLAFTPLAAVPVYCATKAGLHSFTLSLRYQLANTSIKVFEVAPPTVDTDLGGGPGHSQEQGDRGIAPEEVADAVLKSMRTDRFEIVIGAANKLRSAPDKMFNFING